jgi:peptide methionine sulfoxide reductase MsrB
MIFYTVFPETWRIRSVTTTGKAMLVSPSRASFSLVFRVLILFPPPSTFRHFAENGGYFTSTSFEDEVLQAKGPITFYDSVTGKPLFVAPINRSAEDFIRESEVHGWPSFRDEEVVWENVRVLKGSGETVSVDGTHLGHNLPDRKGNRYCINLVSVAGKPSSMS